MGRTLRSLRSLLRFLLLPQPSVGFGWSVGAWSSGRQTVCSTLLCRRPFLPKRQCCAAGVPLRWTGLWASNFQSSFMAPAFRSGRRGDNSMQVMTPLGLANTPFSQTRFLKSPLPNAPFRQHSPVPTVWMSWRESRRDQTIDRRV